MFGFCSSSRFVRGMTEYALLTFHVMPGLDPGIHGFLLPSHRISGGCGAHEPPEQIKEPVDGRIKSGHDEYGNATRMGMRGMGMRRAGMRRVLGTR
jgi:hypothetical protein